MADTGDEAHHNSDKHDTSKEEDEDYDKKEHEHFMRVVEAFKSYRSHCLRRIQSAEDHYLELPDQHQNYLPRFRENLDVMRTCVAHNHEVIKLMLQEAEVLFENKNLTVVNVSEMTFDPMTSSPQLTFSTTGRADRDRKEPDYIALASTPDGNHLVLVDDANRMVKVMAVTSSGGARVTSDVKLSKELWDIALLPDGMVAVTTYNNYFIYLLRLQGDVIEYTSRFRTQKKYDGVVAGLDNDTLLVTSRDYLDVITRDGQVVQSFYVSQFRRPDYMCSAGGDDVIVSDWASQELYRINARTGQVTETMSHPDMETPHQAVLDKGGNLYVASRGSNRVMVMSPAGQWRTLLQGHKLPTGISVTSDDVIVSWADVTISADWDFRSWSIIKGYSMSDVN